MISLEKRDRKILSYINLHILRACLSPVSPQLVVTGGNKEGMNRIQQSLYELRAVCVVSLLLLVASPAIVPSSSYHLVRKYCVQKA